MKNWNQSIHQNILVYQRKELELFGFIFVEVIKKFMGSVFFCFFFFVGSGVSLYMEVNYRNKSDSMKKIETKSNPNLINLFMMVKSTLKRVSSIKPSS